MVMEWIDNIKSPKSRESLLFGLYTVNRIGCEGTKAWFSLNTLTRLAVGFGLESALPSAY